MDETSKKWLTGCGIGCFIVLAVGVLVVFGGYLGVKKIMRQAEQTQRVVDEVTDRFGRASEYTPDPTGAVDADRIAAFLEVRRLSRPERERLEATLGELGPTPGEEASPNTMDFARSVRAGVGVVPQMMGYINRRNAAFLEAGMGLGEYLYLYTLIFESWLENDPGDGPPFMVVGGEVDTADASDPAVRERRGAEIRRRLNRTTLPMLRNQYEALISSAADDGGPWGESLRTEILLMAADPHRLPWQDGLPEPTADSLQPFWEELDASYSPLCHPVELSVIQR